MQDAQVQSEAQEEAVRSAVAEALQRHGATVATNEPGSLIAETGSVGMAYVAGGLRKAEKMPMRITVATAAGGGGTSVSVSVGGRGTGGGISGGLLGMKKQKKGEDYWLNSVIAAIPDRVS